VGGEILGGEILGGEILGGETSLISTLAVSRPKIKEGEVLSEK
jgi:hypothetical protein